MRFLRVNRYWAGRQGCLIAPGFSQHATVVNALITIAQRLRAVIIAMVAIPTMPMQSLIRQLFSSSRVYLVDPQVCVFDKHHRQRLHNRPLLALQA